MAEQDAREKSLLEAVDRGFAWGNTPRAHRILLAITGLGGGSLMFYVNYLQVLKPNHPAPFPGWFLAMEWAIACAGMLLLGEGIWRVNRYIDSAEQKSWVYLIKRGIDPFTLNGFKTKEPAKKD